MSLAIRCLPNHALGSALASSSYVGVRDIVHQTEDRHVVQHKASELEDQ